MRAHLKIRFRLIEFDLCAFRIFICIFLDGGCLVRFTFFLKLQFFRATASSLLPPQWFRVYSNPYKFCTCFFVSCSLVRQLRVLRFHVLHFQRPTSNMIWAAATGCHSHHHQVARSKSIAVSTMRHQEGRSVARRNAECSPRLSGLRSLSIVQSQDWRGRPIGRRQSTGRRSVDARSAREWSSEAIRFDLLRFNDILFAMNMDVV